MDPEEDLLDRYDRIVQTQTETLHGIDEKAATTMRLVSILLGLLLAGAAVVTDIYHAFSVEGSPVTAGWIGAGLLALLVSLSYSLVTYVSSRLLHGPREELGTVLADYDVTESDYAAHMLRGYSDAIRYNRSVLQKNSQRFRRSLQSLLVGMVALSVGIVLLFLSWPLWIEAGISLVLGVASLPLHRAFVDETYLHHAEER